MKILASGMSGTIGSALLPALAEAGHTTVRLKTGTARGPQETSWNPLGVLDSVAVNGFDGVIHLAGENIFGRWSEANKKSIRESRVAGTRNLCQALAASSQKPRVLIAASAVGYYGSNRGSEVLTEESAQGGGFLAETCGQWEQATEPAVSAGIRVVNLRTGVVLARHGGALTKMLTPFRLGFGGKIGSGRQWMSWIHIADAVGAILHCLDHESLRGPVNMTAPNPATNAEFSKKLGRALHRPAIATVPAFALKLLLGSEMARETVLSSQRVLPRKLQASGYRFQCPELAGALHSLLRSAM